MTNLIGPLVFFVILAVIVIWFLTNTLKVVQEYERGVIFRLGRFAGARGPGLIILIPAIERMVRIDLRTITMDVPSQEIITRDNVTVRVNAVAYFRVVDPGLAVVSVTDYIRATSQIAQTTLRSVLGQVELDDLLAERDKINDRLQQIIDQQTEPWGIKVSVVEIRDVELPEIMQRAMARQAEAERERRAKVIAATGELEASRELTEAAQMMARSPASLQLRYLQTLVEVASEKNSTIVFPLPIELLEGLDLLVRRLAKTSGDGAAAPPAAPVAPSWPPPPPPAGPVER
ncbi:MAG: slipin family protein [Chloroflexi bacterium]|nr:slipin family protein [Chloroflexota bacterium]